MRTTDVGSLGDGYGSEWWPALRLRSEAGGRPSSACIEDRLHDVCPTVTQQD
jgi:hypothetical protein